MTLSKFIQKIGNEIERVSGAKINFSQGTTPPSQKWIPEREICQMKPIQLRSAEEMKSESNVELPQFNPSALLNDESKIHCRVPNCLATIPRRKASGKLKQDLFVCDDHRAKLMSVVAQRCAEENVNVNVKSFKAEDFEGYTSLIGELEKAFIYLQGKSWSIFWRPSDLDKLLGEVFLNARNFLVITNVLLNPDVENSFIALGTFLSLLTRFLNNLDHDDDRENIFKAFRYVTETTLCFFGVVYKWIVVDFFNPGGRMGAGVGLVLGFVGGVAFPPAGWLAASMVGLVGGGLFGSGAFSLYERRRYNEMQERMAQEYSQSMANLLGRPVHFGRDLIFVLSNPSGDLAISRFRQN